MSSVIKLTDDLGLTPRAEMGDLKRIKVHALQQASANFRVRVVVLTRAHGAGATGSAGGRHEH